jgi:hypothetical protein
VKRKNQARLNIDRLNIKSLFCLRFIFWLARDSHVAFALQANFAWTRRPADRTPPPRRLGDGPFKTFNVGWRASGAVVALKF